VRREVHAELVEVSLSTRAEQRIVRREVHAELVEVSLSLSLH